MVDEKDVLDFLKNQDGQASLDEVSSGLSVPKYGPDSAYATLQSLKEKGIVKRKGESWVLVKEVEHKLSSPDLQGSGTEGEKGKSTSEVDKIVEAMDIYGATKNDASLKHFLDDLKDAFTRKIALDH